MRRRALLTRVSALVPFLVAMTTAPCAHATDEKQACVRAVEHAQVERLEGKLREARDGLVSCARAACPQAIREDCTRWLSEVDASLPTIVVHAVWADGRDVAGLSVKLDGRPLDDAAFGRAVALDPGEHTFHFEAPGASPVETRNVIREGEKNRLVNVTLGPTGNAHAGSPPSPQTLSVPSAVWHVDPREAGASTTRPIPTSAFVFGGLALAGFGGFAYAGLSGTGELDHLRSTCAPSCDPSRVTSARREILIGDILGFVALAAAGVTTWLVFTRPQEPARDAARKAP